MAERATVVVRTVAGSVWGKPRGVREVLRIDRTVRAGGGGDGSRKR